MLADPVDVAVDGRATPSAVGSCEVSSDAEPGEEEIDPGEKDSS